MSNFRSSLALVVGFLSFVALALLTFSVTLAFGLALTAILGIRALAWKKKPSPAPVRAKAHRSEREIRVWNDGRGTIIDL